MTNTDAGEWERCARDYCQPIKHTPDQWNQSHKRPGSSHNSSAPKSSGMTDESIISFAIDRFEGGFVNDPDDRRRHEVRDYASDAGPLEATRPRCHARGSPRDAS